eukprot:scaffold79_cov259-Pinguiococcus_pyrenoidosus.AAC.22
MLASFICEKLANSLCRRSCGAPGRRSSPIRFAAAIGWEPVVASAAWTTQIAKASGEIHADVVVRHNHKVRLARARDRHRGRARFRPHREGRVANARRRLRLSLRLLSASRRLILARLQLPDALPTLFLRMAEAPVVLFPHLLALRRAIVHMPRPEEAPEQQDGQAREREQRDPLGREEQVLPAHLAHVKAPGQIHSSRPGQGRVRVKHIVVHRLRQTHRTVDADLHLHAPKATERHNPDFRRHKGARNPKMLCEPRRCPSSISIWCTLSKFFRYFDNV